MAHGVNNKTGSSFLVVALAAILILGGVLAACKQAQTTTSAPVPTSTSVTTRTTTSSSPATTSATATASTSVPSTTTSAPASTATGVSAADFYKANLATIVVLAGPGGGVDYAARLFANYWTEVTGGRMIVVNKEGAGGITGANYAYSAKPDGLTVAAAIPGSYLVTPTLAQDPAVRFDIKKIVWIGYLNPEGYGLSVGTRFPNNSIESISKEEGLKFSSNARGSMYSFGAGLVIDWFGLKGARIVVGYAGSAECLLSVGKGETDAFTGTGSNILDGMGKGFMKPPILFLDPQRSLYFPDVPAIAELLKLSTDQESLLGTFAAFNSGQGFWFGPGVPQERIEFVRNVFDKIVTNESFVKQAKTRWPIWVTPTSGKDFASQMERNLAVATPERFNALQKTADKYIR